MRRVLFLLLPLLSGCATGPGLESRMAAYIGAPEQNLVESLGVPDKQIAVNGVEYLAYVRSRTQIEPSAAGIGVGFGGGPFGGPGYGGFSDAALPQNVQVWSCETIFIVKDGRVANVTFKGNDCD